jgi:hypothetical protein
MTPSPNEMRYFLPRYLELIAIDDIPDHTLPEKCLRRLAEAEWRTNWPEAEVPRQSTTERRHLDPDVAHSYERFHSLLFSPRVVERIVAGEKSTSNADLRSVLTSSHAAIGPFSPSG